MAQTDLKASGDTDNDNEKWTLRLYVAGQTGRSLAALSNLKTICEEHLAGKYTIQVIDLIEKPQLAKGDQILGQAHSPLYFPANDAAVLT